MAKQPQNKYVHTINGQHVGFMYEPGANMRAQGLIAQHFALGPKESLLPTDAARVAISRFNGVVVYGRTN